MVAMTAPTPKDVICDPASGTCGFLVAAGEYLREKHPTMFSDASARAHFHHGMFHGYDFDNTMLRIALDIFFRRVILVLHRRHALEPDAPSRYPVSYWSSLECSLALLVSLGRQLGQLGLVVAQDMHHVEQRRPVQSRRRRQLYLGLRVERNAQPRGVHHEQIV